MKLALAVAALLFAGVAQAQSVAAYDVNAFANFDVNGQQIDISYSDQISVSSLGNPITEEMLTMSNLSFSVADSGNDSWTLIPNDGIGGTFALSDGTLLFSSSISCACVGGAIDQEMFGPNGPTGSFIGTGATFTPVPEPSTYAMLAASILGLLMFSRYVKTKVQ